MSHNKMIEQYRGHEIIRRSTVKHQFGFYYVIRKNGIESALTPGSVEAAKRMIDVWHDRKIDMYEAA